MLYVVVRRRVRFQICVSGNLFDHSVELTSTKKSTVDYLVGGAYRVRNYMVRKFLFYALEGGGFENVKIIFQSLYGVSAALQLIYELDLEDLRKRLNTLVDYQKRSFTSYRSGLFIFLLEDTVVVHYFSAKKEASN